MPVFQLMRKILLLTATLILSILSFGQTCSSGLSGTYMVGPGGSYATLTAALAALRTNGAAGPVVLELATAYTSTAETFPISFSGIGCLSDQRRLTVRPEAGATALVITTANSTATLSFDNARYVTIDGRPGGAGTTGQLKLANTSQSSAVTRFYNDASYNILTYLTFQTAGSGQGGHVYFGTTNQAVTAGNSYNEVSNCVLKFDTYVPNNSCIYSLGTDNKKNRGNVVKNCEFSNYNEAGVSLQKNSEAWRIEGNSFYGRSCSKASIYIYDTTSSNFEILGNFVGGTGPNCSGTPMQTVDYFTGILLYTGNNGYTSVQGNTVANVNTIGNNGYFFAALQLAYGKFKAGTVTSNIIGSQTVTNSLRFGMNSIFADHFEMYGILAGSRWGGYEDGIDTTFIQNNKVSGLEAYQNANGFGDGTVAAIAIRYQSKGYIVITDNTIGNPTQYNSILNRAYPGSPTIGVYIMNGWSGNGQYVKNLVKNNTITNLSGNCFGVNVTGGSAEVVGNTIKGLYANYFTTDNGGATGIYFSNCPKGQVIKGNTIHTLYSKTQSPYVSGIELTYTNYTTIEKNNIHSLQVTGTLNSGTFKGIEVNHSWAERIQNNTIRLGVDTLGNAINGNHIMFGISVEADSSVIQHNSVYIGGTGDAESSALYCANGARRIVNNILYNARSGTASGQQTHCAFRYYGSDVKSLGLNYNLYYAPGVRGFIGSVYYNYSTYNAATISEWRTFSKSDSNSMAYAPNFINATGTAITGDLHLANPNPAEGQGFALAEVTDDIDGENRAGLSPADIGADAGDFSLQDGDAPVLTHKVFNGMVLNTGYVFEVKITDNGGGVDSAGTNKPRMWFRKKYPATSSWASSPGTLLSGSVKSGTWGFTPDLLLTGATYAPGDSLEYYFVAQDKGPVINLGYSNKVGTAHSSVTTQTTPPVTPLTFVAMGYFADTVYVGAGQTYTSLTNAGGFFDATGRMTFLPGNKAPLVYITSDLIAETGTFPYKNMTDSTTRIVLTTNTPTVKQVRNSSSATRGLIALNNVRDLTIDGSVGGYGRYLQFSLQQPGSNYTYPTLQVFSAERTAIRNCIFENNASYSGGTVISFYSQLLKSVEIYNNLIRNLESVAGSALPATGLAIGINSGDSVVIRSNEFANFASTGLSLTQSTFTPTVRIIADSNHFYHNSATAASGGRTAIVASIGYPVVITNNFIGGSAPYCGGGPWTFSTQVSGASFKGVDIDVSKDSVSTILGNTVRNVHFTNWGYSFYGLYIRGNSRVNVFRNSIGDTTKDSSIYAKENATGIWAYVARYTNYNPLVNVQENVVGGITAAFMEGIYVETTKANVSNNTVTRLRTHTGPTSSLAGFRGIRLWDEEGVLEGNLIYDLANYNTNPWATNGIEHVGYGALPKETVMSRNKVWNLYSSSTSKPLTGMLINSMQEKIRNNTISLTNGSAASGALIYGMYFTSGTSNVFRSEVQYNSIYIGGASNNSAKTAAVYIDGGTPITSFKNNLLYNERSGTGTHLALAMLPDSGPSAWTTAGIPNNNLYVTKDTSIVNEWRTQGTMGLPSWRRAVGGDSASFAASAVLLPATSLFANTATGDLHINSSDPNSWAVNGKGLPVSGVSGDIDTTEGARSTTLDKGPTDIGADEFTTGTLPPVMTVTGNHQPGGADTLSYNGRIYAIISWGPGGTLPQLGESRFYSGVPPMDSTNNGAAFFARYLSGWWDLPVTGGSGYTYNLTLFFDSSMLGAVTDPSTMVINKRQHGVPGSWVALPTVVDAAARTITLTGQTSFSQFSGSDYNATLQTGVATPDLSISWKEVGTATLSTGTTATVRFIEKNSGSAVAPAHKVAVYLSGDAVLTPGANSDTLLAEQILSSGPAAGASTDTISKTITVPCNRNTGAQYLIFVSDAGAQVMESYEDNNTATLAVQVVTGISTPQSPVITATPGLTVCGGTPVTLSLNGAPCSSCNYQWSGTPVNMAGPSLTVTTSGTYTITATNSCGSASASQTVTVNPKPVVSVTGGAAPYCAGSTINLSASGAASYAWSGPGLSATTASVSFAVSTAGQQAYQVIGTTNGCKDTMVLNLTVNPAATVTAGADTSICSAGTATLVATGNASTYAWQPGTTNTTGSMYVVSPSATTVYTVTATTAAGCSASDQVGVSVTPSVTPTVSISYTGCGSGTLVFTATATNGGTAPVYAWFVNGAQAGTGTSFTLNNATNGAQVYTKLTSNAVCATTAVVQSATTTVSCTATSVPSITGVSELSIGPNPTSSVLYVKMALSAMNKYAIEVMDITGRTVYQSGSKSGSGRVTETLEVGQWPDGLYLLKLTLGSKSFVERIVIQH